MVSGSRSMIAKDFIAKDFIAKDFRAHGRAGCLPRIAGGARPGLILEVLQLPKRVQG